MKVALPVQAPKPAAPATVSIAQDPELLNDVILESGEHLASVENELMNLERDASNQEAIHTIFRSFHTIKGLAGFLELDEIQKVSHHTESLLDDARNGKLRITPAVADVILASKDYLERAFQQLASVSAGAPPQPFADNRALLERIDGVAKGGDASEAAQNAEAPPAAPVAVAEATPREAEAGGRTARTESHTVKVDTAKLDYLVDMIGELVIAQSQVRHDPGLATVESARLQRNLAQVTRTTAELQRTGMAMRMVPVGHLFRRMVRLVRDLARKAGKQTELDIVGEDTELDRTIVEELSDPLVHMIRNSMDHGLEGPEERIAAGKDPTGRIRLRASHNSGHILIEISDDGRGIDRQKGTGQGAAKRAGGRGGAHPRQRDSEPDFRAGLLDRGEGHRHLRPRRRNGRGPQTGGKVARADRDPVHARPGDHVSAEAAADAGDHRRAGGRGRTRALHRAAICGSRDLPSDTGYAFDGLREGRNGAHPRKLAAGGATLSRFGVQPRTEDPCEAVFIVAENGGKFFCLMVDEFIGKQEVVLKSLGESLKNIPGVAGGAILGDGRVGLVLDLDGIYEKKAHE